MNVFVQGIDRDDGVHVAGFSDDFQIAFPYLAFRAQILCAAYKFFDQSIRFGDGRKACLPDVIIDREFNEDTAKDSNGVGM